MPRRSCLLALPLAVACASRVGPPVPPPPAAPPAIDPLVEHTDQMWAWFPGEYSNHEQVTEQKYAEQEPYEHLHQIFLPVEVPGLGDKALFVQQHMVGNPKPYRVRIYTLQPDPARDAVRLDIYKPTDPAVLTNLHLDPARAATLDPERDLQLAGRRDLGADARLAQHLRHGDRGVGLDGPEQLHPRAERRPHLLDPGAQRVGREQVERRAVARDEVRDRDLAEPQRLVR